MRLLRRFLVGLLALVLAATAAIGVYAWRLPRDDLDATRAGSLAVADTARGSWKIGSLDVSLSADRLTIQEGGRTVWASVADTAFVSAATGKVDVEEHRGYFWPDVQYTDQWRDQRVESVEQKGEGLHLTGTAEDIDWSMDIAPRDAGGAMLSITVTTPTPSLSRAVAPEVQTSTGLASSSTTSTSTIPCCRSSPASRASVAGRNP